ncbi:hypothetical protein BGW36DRAFT_103081 [Talaromyces proteolyticus]|uniref:C2H2-type domain-containing protein n=1 Tax=Talaromyces proteolyticus TaxID=1131652 RepID=A0AAD4KXN2_9EURO|nr:uncharacterized protein BGW36DRAFT_103081 [Talaromyces proteolyticus]KAH8701703.1 hypothetical protein BGW36DRAFT_103081 [Talaromyces proteolyticus]
MTMNVTQGQLSASAEGLASENWDLGSLFIPGMVDLDRGLNNHMPFNPSPPPHTDVQQSLTSCAPPDALFWPSLSPELQQLSFRNYQYPASLSPFYSTQTPTSTSNIQPRNTDSQRKHKQQHEAKHRKKKSDPLDIRCWNHNCDGRRFSSLGNYRRHLREKEGNAKMFRCQDCGRLFTRSTARNFHRQSGTCRATTQALGIPSMMSSSVHSHSHSQSQSPTVSSVSSIPWSDVSLPSDDNLDLNAYTEEPL